MENRGWVFISHSHKDVEYVRKIRNYFEERGFEPLMFYLKCLSDKDEIEDLIKREIDVREWFVYIDSINARTSNWVKTEREHIKKLPGKKIFVIDLSEDPEIIKQELEHITRQMKVYISYSHADSALCDRIRKKLAEKDMLVLSDRDIHSGSNFAETPQNNLSDSCRDGFVLLMVTEESSRSAHIEHEIMYAKKSKGKIVPVYIGNASLSPELIPLLGTVQGVHLSEEPTDDELDELVAQILHRVEYYANDFTNSYGFRSAETIHLPPIAEIDDLTFWDCPCLKCVYVPDSVVSITPDAFKGLEDVLIKCSAGSYCEDYCKRKGLKYEIIDAE